MSSSRFCAVTWTRKTASRRAPTSPDADLEMIMCRDDLLGLAKPNPRSGPGWEEVEDRSGMSLLGNVNKE